MINKKIIITILFILLNNIVSCNQNADKQGNNTYVKYKEEILQNLTCQEIVEKIVSSSSLDLKVYKDYLVDIDNIKNDSVFIHVYFENNLSDDPKQKQIVESTIAWLLLLPNKEKLYNMTIVPEAPIELEFNKKILAENNIFQQCKISKEIIKIKEDVEYKVSSLPFDFANYYATCFESSDDKKCNEDYPKYGYDKQSDLYRIIGDEFYCSEYTYLPKINHYQPIILYDDIYDIERYYLIIVKDGKIISDLLIGQMDGENIQDFNISKDYIITLYNRKNAEDMRKEKSKYKILSDGSIKRIDSNVSK